MAAAKQAVRRKDEAGSRVREVEIERQAGVLVLTLARPERRNSLSEAMLGALQAGIDEASQDAGVRAVVIAAKGTAFCAGHDLKELSARRSDADGGHAYYALIMRLCADLMRAIVRCPKPVIAAVQGAATAAGCQLVASCDLAVAAEQASFATPGVNIGLFCSTPMVALSRNVPRKRAMEMLLLGEMLPAHARGRVWPRQPRGARGQGDGRSPGLGPARSPPSRPPRLPSARRRSTGRSRCRWPRPTTMRPASWSPI